jgi:hypothetical protein
MKLAEDKLNAAVAALQATQTAYPATGSVVSFIFYLQFQVNITNGKSFNGKAGGSRRRAAARCSAMSILTTLIVSTATR